MRQLASGAIGILAIILALTGFYRSYKDENECLMSYRYEDPVYIPLKSSETNPYSLYLFRETRGIADAANPENSAHKLGGTPVLFIPGNAGSYKQGLAFGSLCSMFPEFDWFLLDFNEDMSALHGKTLIDEAAFANEAIEHILSIYKQASKEVGANQTNWENDPESVIVVGHSMGGIVARTLVTLDNYIPDSVNTIFTFSSPHALPPITFDRDVTQLYDVVGQWWRNNAQISAPVELVSVAGGHMDYLVPPGLTLADSFGGISALSHEVPTVGIGIHHLDIVWCVQFRKVFIDCLVAIANHSKPSRTRDNRRKVIERHFKHPRRLGKTAAQFDEEGDDINVAFKKRLGPSILYGFSNSFDLPAGVSKLEMPSRSSLISYHVQTSSPVKLSQFTPLEYREYGNVTARTLMWSTAPPFVPFQQPAPPRLVIELVSDVKVSAMISVDWGTTFANMFLYYRTIAGSWPFGIILAALCLTYVRPTVSFASHLLGGIAGRYFLQISAVLSVLHLLCTLPGFRFLLRLIQIPSEASTIAGLKIRGYDNNDLLLGNMEPHMFWVPPVVFALACWFAAIVLGATYVLAFFNGKVRSLLGFSRRCATGESSELKEKYAAETSSSCNSSTSTLAASDPKTTGGSKITLRQGLLWGTLLPILYTVPFQASTVFFTILELLKLSGIRDWRIPRFQVLLWASVVDGPTVVVWLRNLSPKWLLSFSGIANGVSALIFAAWVLYKPHPKNFRREREGLLERTLPLVVLAFGACYAVIYGGLHSFMIYHIAQVYFLLLLIQRIRE